MTTELMAAQQTSLGLPPCPSSDWAIFSSSQTAGFQEILTEVEILAVIVGCLCYDLDHRGTNNAFQAK